ncbi:hypothetical protein LTR97_006834 [Elasticomyces elasticus]|uniref:Uncharacterized protein n=1 Tax=Elasticomyces elasticus TaxID=574655 RepID=A0AAN7W8T4_9PEZI|nr:hypothetical protein LTR97_006834 [Elasticomyces elasticus]
MAVHGTTLVGLGEQMTWVEEMIEQNDLTKLAELEEHLFLGVEDHDMELHPTLHAAPIRLGFSTC